MLYPPCCHSFGSVPESAFDLVAVWWYPVALLEVGFSLALSSRSRTVPICEGELCSLMIALAVCNVIGSIRAS